MFLDLLQGLCASVVHVLSPQDSPQVSAHNALQVAGEFVPSLCFAGILSFSLSVPLSVSCLSLSFLTYLCLFHRAFFTRVDWENVV